jgi:thioredoxin type arsenate reductase
MTAGPAEFNPPPVLKLLSHALRWRLLASLALSDLKVQELVQRLGRPQNLVSYHLKQLRAARLVSERRSAADARVVYYSLNFEEVRLLFQEAGESLHPSLSETRPGGENPSLPKRHSPVRVLFLCTHNSARSQMAEGLMRHRAGSGVEVFSAGTEATRVNPLSIRALADMNIDISGQRSKHLDEFRGQTFDYVITVCDRARESCPLFPGDPVQIHWSFPDPAAVEGTESERYAAFRETALQLNHRIGLLMLLINRDVKPV